MASCLWKLKKIRSKLELQSCCKASAPCAAAILQLLLHRGCEQSTAGAAGFSAAPAESPRGENSWHMGLAVLPPFKASQDNGALLVAA